MKFLLLTDTHIRGTNPQNRKDNFVVTLLAKIEEVVNLAINHQVDYVLHNGDLFDRPDVAPSIVREFVLILKKCPAPILSIAGNHDIYGYNPDTLPRTMMGLLDGLDIIKLIHPEEKIFLSKDGLIVQITGQHFYYDLDRVNRKKDYIITKDSKAYYALHMVHGMLLKKPFFEGIPYTLIDDILDTEADVTFSGHYHSGYNLVEVNKKYFINPGSLVRVNNSIAELTRWPQVAIVDFNFDGIEFELIKLSSALPGEQVLDREQLFRHEYREKKLADFTQGIKSVGDVKLLDINDIMEQIANEAQLSEQVVREAIERISHAQQEKLWRE